MELLSGIGVCVLIIFRRHVIIVLGPAQAHPRGSCGELHPVQVFGKLRVIERDALPAQKLNDAAQVVRELLRACSRTAVR